MPWLHAWCIAYLLIVHAHKALLQQSFKCMDKDGDVLMWGSGTWLGAGHASGAGHSEAHRARAQPRGSARVAAGAHRVRSHLPDGCGSLWREQVRSSPSSSSPPSSSFFSPFSLLLLHCRRCCLPPFFCSLCLHIMSASGYSLHVSLRSPCIVYAVTASTEWCL